MNQQRSRIGRVAYTRSQILFRVHLFFSEFTGSEKEYFFGHGYQDKFTQTFFASVKKRNASNPPSRPTPELFTPPNGVRRSRTSQQLIHTIPLSSFVATRCALFTSCVHTVAARPYCVLLAYSNASSSVSKG